MFKSLYTYKELDKISKDLEPYNDVISRCFNIDTLPTYNDYFNSLSSYELQSNYKDIYKEFYLIEYRINKLPIEIWNIIIEYYLYNYLYWLSLFKVFKIDSIFCMN